MARQLVTTEETAKRLAVSIPTLRRWRSEGIGPTAYHIGHRWQYDEQELNDFIDSCREAPAGMTELNWPQ